MPALATGGSAHPKISGLLALSISRSLCEKISQALGTSDRDGSSPGRAVRGNRGTARELLQAGCDSAAPRCVEALGAAKWQPQAVHPRSAIQSGMLPCFLGGF